MIRPGGRALADRQVIALMLESDGPGGAERMLIQLGEELRRRGHDVVPVGPAKGCGWLGGEFRERGFIPETFHLRFPVDPGCAAGLKRTLRVRGVTAVHSHEFTMAFYGAVASRSLGLPHVVTMHGGLGFTERWRRRVAFRLARRWSRAVVAVSRASALEMERRLGLKPGAFRVIPNGIQPEIPRGNDIRQELGLAPGTPLIVAVGNLYPVKGHEYLLRALATVGGGAHLIVAGRGEEAGHLTSCAVTLGLTGQVHFLGYRADIADLLLAADVFCMPSLSEGMPLALIEAMFARKAIVASAVGGIPEMVVEGSEALLVPPGQAAPLAAALSRVLGDRLLRSRLGDAAAERAASGFSVGAMTDAYLALYAGAPSARSGVVEGTGQSAES